jgi:thermitase
MRFPALRPTLALLLSACLPALGFAAPPAGTPPSTAPVTLLVKPAAHASENALAALFAAQGAQEFDRVPALNLRLLRVPAVAAERIQAALEKRPEIDYAEPDAVAHAIATPNDPSYGSQWHLTKIQAPLAWDVSTGSPKVIIAVIDSGVNAGHPDLAGRVLPGYDFVNGDSDAHDDNGHGTAVAGVAAASTNNALGVAGLTWSSPVLPVKVLGADGSGSYSNIIKGITFSADSGARIINLSLGGTSSSRALQDAVNYAWGKSAVLIAAAGNNGNSTPVYPAACNLVVAVSATDSKDARPSWSNFGSYVELSAPGVSILTTHSASGYANYNGTSFSSPVAAGVAALVAATWPAASNAQIVDLLLKNADDIGAAGYDVYYGHGRVNAARAVLAASQAVAPDTTAPSAYFGSPAAGATVSGTVTISGDATDNVGVSRLELRIDGSLVASVNASTTSHAWDTRLVGDGPRVLELRAFDAAGNVGTTTRSVTVSNQTAVDTIAPVSAITSPADGSRITTRQVSINVTSSDNVGVVKLELYINGRLFGTSSASSATFNWNTNKVSSGAHRLQSFATDAAGNVGASPIITVYK